LRRLGQSAYRQQQLWLALICAVFFAVLSVPFMRWGVSILGALSGGILTSGAWLALGLPQQYIWAGGLVGLIAGGMISFIIFKIAVILFTSLGGSVLLAVGALAVVHGNLLPEEDLKELISSYQWLLPALLLVPMAVGIFLQNKSLGARTGTPERARVRRRGVTLLPWPAYASAQQIAE
jgi:hypothetical protein